MNVPAVRKLLIVCLVVHIAYCIAMETTSNYTITGKKQKGTVHGPVYTFLKTDKNANVKWGVRHYIPRRSRRMPVQAVQVRPNYALRKKFNVTKYI